MVDSDVPQVKMLTSVIRSGYNIQLQLDGVEASDVQVHIVGLSGIIVDAAPLNRDGSYTIPSTLSHGLYFITFSHGTKADTYKVIVK